MFKANVEIEGVDECIAALKKINKESQKAVRREVATYAREARDDVKAATPVVSGRLRRAVKVVGSKPKGKFYSYRVISSNKGGPSGQGGHFHFVNYGTKKMSGRHYAEPIRAKYARGPLGNRIRLAVDRVIAENITNARK